MTTKPKTSKAQAKPKKAPGAPKREASKIQELIARWEWLEADQNYQTAIAAPECDADRRHDAEQERIIKKLRTLVPQDYYELAALFKFVLAQIKVADALRCDGADIDMLTNIVEALPAVIRYEMEAARRTGMTNMRDFLSRRTGAAFNVAKEPKAMERIQYGNTGWDNA